jgi:hypothetical protein
VLGIVAAFAFASAADQERVLQVRSFFGALTVRYQKSENGNFMRLVHGTTVHGMQYHDPEHINKERRREALMYYHRTGPIGQVFDAFQGPTAKKNIAVIGLGTGTLAAYGESGQRFTFYEIDNLVKDIAYNPEYFTYLSDAEDRGVEVTVVPGDARLQLEKVQPGLAERYDLIVIDAFSSDAIPVHLITKQALDLYLASLAEGGLVAFHISNVYLNLEPVVANLAEARRLTAILRRDDDQSFPGKSASVWVILGRKEADFGPLQAFLRELESSKATWRHAKVDPDVGVWTDDYSNLLQVFTPRSKEEGY